MNNIFEINPEIIINDENGKARLGKLYLCNRKKCRRCKPECSHTTDKRYALNINVPPAKFR